MILLGIDLETTGLNKETDSIIEIGAVLWDTELSCPIRIFNTLVNTVQIITPQIEKITGITQSMLETHGVPPTIALSSISKMMSIPGITAIVAHNGNEFDKPFLYNYSKRLAVTLPDLHWIDTLKDVPFPEDISTRKLTHLAAEHGFLNPFSHRAVFDVLTMFEIIKRYNIEEILAVSRESMVELEAITVPPWEDEGKSTNEAKARGFRWDASTKRWIKSVKSSVAEKEIKAGGCVAQWKSA